LQTTAQIALAQLLQTIMRLRRFGMTIAKARSAVKSWHDYCMLRAYGAFGTVFAPPSTWHGFCLSKTILELGMNLACSTRLRRSPHQISSSV
jgi:hypothetical protein